MMTQARLYQGRSGFIYLTLGGWVTKLIREQITDLHLDLSTIADFDNDRYEAAYGLDVIEDDDDRETPQPGDDHYKPEF